MQNMDYFHIDFTSVDVSSASESEPHESYSVIPFENG